MARQPKPGRQGRTRSLLSARHDRGASVRSGSGAPGRGARPAPAAGSRSAQESPGEPPRESSRATRARVGTLYVVATPIGNLEDITLRALGTLRSVALIACEDTRRTRALLDHHGIAGTLIPYHKFNERSASARIVQRLLDGDSVALVSDGGTPAISDPGYLLVRDALGAGAEVIPIPGPSALAAAVSASGLPSECVTFRGFLPHRLGERRRLLQAIRGETATQVFFEAPHRIVPSLLDLSEILGARRAAVAREMTKRFETWVRGPLPDVAERVARGTLKGEFCIVVEGAARRETAGPGPDRSDPDGIGIPGKSGFPTGADCQGSPRTARTGAAPSGDGALPGGKSAPSIGQAASLGPGALREFYERELASGLDRREALRRAAHACGLTRKEAYRRLNAAPADPTG